MTRRTTQAEEKAKSRRKGRMGWRRCGEGTHGSFGFGKRAEKEERGAQLSQGRREERSTALIEQGGAEGVGDGERWSPVLPKSSCNVCICVCVCALCEVKPLTAVLLLGDSADNIAGVHEAQELRKHTSKQVRLDLTYSCPFAPANARITLNIWI